MSVDATATSATPVAEDRLLDHYALLAARRSACAPTVPELAAARTAVDTNPCMQTLLGRTGGGYGYLRALVIAGVATVDERSDINDFA